jgi:hypothetical protein
MRFSEAVIEFLRSEVVPHIAGDSEMTAAILSGALRAGRKRIASTFENSDFVKIAGLADLNGSSDPAAVKDFLDGMFDGRDKISISLAEMVRIATGVESSSPLLANKISFTRADADRFLAILSK